MRPDTITQTLLNIWENHCKEGDYVFVSKKNAASGSWKDHAIKYDKSIKKKLRQWLKQNSADKYDLYFCPLPFTQAARRETHLRGSKYLWSDLDEVDVDSLPFTPSLHWESSPGRFQGLWVLDRFMEPEEVKSLNKSLTYASGADKGGWDLTQVLRIPGTKNHKYEGTPSVGEVKNLGKEYKVKQLQNTLNKEPTSKEEPDIPELSHKVLLAKYRRKLPRKVIKLLTTSKPEIGKRSDIIWYLENELMDAGLSPPEIFTLIKHSPWNKYAGRHDEDIRLKTELKKIIEGKVKEDDPTPDEADEQLGLRVESYSEFMGSIKRYPGWLIEGFWMRRSHGIIAGEPKSFKSILSTDLAISVASGKPFLGQFPVIEQGPVLIVQNENDAWIVEDRVQKMITHKGLVGKVSQKNSRVIQVTFPPVLPLHFINQQGVMIGDPIHQEIIEKVIKEVRPVLVVFDPLYLMFDGDLNSAKDLNPVLNWLLKIKTEYNTGVLVVHHLNKSAPSTRGVRNILGSVTLAGWYESAWVIRVKGDNASVQEEEAEDEHSSIVKTSGEPVPLVIEREFRGGGVRRKIDMVLELGEVGDPKYKATVERHVGRGRPAATSDALDAIQNILTMHKGPVSQRRLSEETGVGRRALKKMLDQLAEEERVNITREGVILLKEEE